MTDSGLPSDCHTPSSNSVSGTSSNTSFRITLIGQPNSGKTTLFNILTGSHFKTSNYPGTTVEFLVGRMHERFKCDAQVIDSPGINSLTPQSLDEKVSVDSLFLDPNYRHPDLVLVTADATQLSRQLYLVKQLIDAGFPVIVALTMNDLLQKRGFSVDTTLLSERLGTPVVKTYGHTESGVAELAEAIRGFFAVTQKYILPPIPRLQSESAVMELYRITESIEKEVIRPFSVKPDIHAINHAVFNTRTIEPDETSLKLDRIFLHPIWGMFFFVFFMALIFTSVFWLAQPMMDVISEGFDALANLSKSWLPSSHWFGNLIADGLITGMGTVMTFVPQIVILFLLMGMLEDSGYLSRGAMLIDKPLSKIGLNGRSFVPMLSGFACAIPATMAARTIPNQRERLLTIFIIPLMTCSARLPVYALLLGFLMPPDRPWLSGLILAGIYFVSLINGALVAGIVSRFIKEKTPSGFMLELPAYRKPILRFILRNTFQRSVSYIQNAGTTIILCSIIIWGLTYFPNANPEITDEAKASGNVEQWIAGERTSSSYAAMVGRWIEPALIPLGWDWRVGVGMISAFAAREVFVSATALTFHIAEDDEDNMQQSLINSMRTARHEQTGKPVFTVSSVVAIVIFFMFALQCTSTLAVVRKETGSWKMPLIQQVAFTSIGYGLGWLAVVLLNAVGIA